MSTLQPPSQEHQPSEETRAQRPPTRLECWLLRKLLGTIGDPPVVVCLWNGEVITTGNDANPVARVTFHDRAAFWRVIVDPLFQFGEAYADGRLSVDGDLVKLQVTLEKNMEQAGNRRSPAAAISRWLHTSARSSLKAARKNIHHHYDIGNQFYKLWLDEQLVYTCAYFPDPACTLEEAQTAKMDHVCRKVRLQPGETVIEAGCGWGSLALHMARHYGVTVRAFNISAEQVDYAREEARRQGLDGQVEFVADDWRNITGSCDAFVSVGMLEHAGRKNYRLLSDLIDRTLKPAGRGLIHSIGRIRPAPLNPWIEQRIFPGAYPPSLREMVEIAEPYNFSILDIENLRLHYAETIRHWLERFEEAVPEVCDMFNERFVKTWRLYLAGSIAAFETGGLQLFQMVFTRQDNNQIPWTRAHLYPPQENKNRNETAGHYESAVTG